VEPTRIQNGQGLAEQLAEMARGLQEPDSLISTFEAIVLAAVKNIPGADHASISAVRKHEGVQTLAASDDVANLVDQAQYDAKEGPCLDTLHQQHTVRVPDLPDDGRWPAFAARASERGIGSMLGVRLYVAGDELGALNLSSHSRDAFDDESEELALLFAAHAAIAMADAEKRANLRIALASRDLIGQAKGILMERHKLTANQAFRLLVEASQLNHRKLRDIAAELTMTGDLPGR
jgi:GAF domain-containing protein